MKMLTNKEIKEIAIRQSAEDIGCKAESLYLPEWSNALCSDRKNLDVLGVGAYDKDKLIGFAACSADCDDMWQIGLMQALI